MGDSCGGLKEDDERVAYRHFPYMVNRLADNSMGVVRISNLATDLRTQKCIFEFHAKTFITNSLCMLFA